MRRIVTSIFVFFSIVSFTGAQEVLTGISKNVTLKNRPHPKTLYQTLEESPLTLPFFDDFSDSDIYPDQNRWADNEAFINQDYALNPISVGVATMDAINSDGDIYENANVFPFEADHLTSRPVRLDSVFSPQPKALTPEDSLYLSFYYQPQGMGNDPQPADSLVLQFLAVSLNDTVVIDGAVPAENDTIIYEGWTRVWASGGMKIDTFAQGNRYFRRVMIPITDSAKYFNDQFQFRFVNYASLADNSLMSWQSNVDHWNIDYVELDWDRSVADTISEDVTFVSGSPSFLKRYASMPYWQYRTNFVNEMRLDFDMLIANLDDEPHNTSYVYNVYNPSGDIIETYDGGFYTLTPFYEDGYVNYPNFSNPEVTLPFPFTTDSISFEIEHVLSSDASLLHQGNDTVRAIQTFSNYYAYDDGTAEAGYGVTPSGAKLAYRFQLNDPDTLRSVRIFFNKTMNDANQQFFYLNVWADNNGVPGELLYRSEKGIMPEFGEGLNDFVSYDIDPVIFKARNTTFYIGWDKTSDAILNVGFDFSRDNSTNLFYNTSGEWLNSRYQGSLMVRPVFGVNAQNNAPQAGSSAKKLEVYPNPAHPYENITIKLPDSFNMNDHLTMKFYSLDGRVVYEGDYQQSFSAGGALTKGIYLIRVYNPADQKVYSNKIVITQ